MKALKKAEVSFGDKTEKSLKAFGDSSRLGKFTSSPKGPRSGVHDIHEKSKKKLKSSNIIYIRFKINSTEDFKLEKN